MMSAIPQYYIPIEKITALESYFNAVQLQLTCTGPRHLQKDEISHYTAWEVRDSKGFRTSMWAIENPSKGTNIAAFTIGSLDGKKGFPLLKEVQKILTDLSVKIDNPENQLR